MSQNNQHPGICDKCKHVVVSGAGVIRRWNGAARKHKPPYAKPTAMGVFTALLCAGCDAGRESSTATWRLHT